MPRSSKDRLSPETILTPVKNGRFAPVYFLYGKEEFLIEELIDAIVAGAVDPATREFNLDILRGEETDARDVISAARSFPMMAERRVVVVKEMERMANIKLLDGYVENPLPTTVLVLAAGQIDLRKSSFATIRKHSVGGELPSLYDSEIPAWIEQHLMRAGKTIAPGAVELMHAYVGNSLRALANEIEKLLVAVGDRPAVQQGDIEAVVGVSREFTIFELANALGRRQGKRALEITQRMLDRGEKPQFIIAMLAGHFTVLWKLAELRERGETEAAILSAVHMNPMHLRECLAHIRQYPRAAIEDALLALAKADARVKSSSTDLRLIMDVLLVEILRRPAAAASPEFSRAQR